MILKMAQMERGASDNNDTYRVFFLTGTPLKTKSMENLG